jgi:hypothetical protein
VNPTPVVEETQHSSSEGMNIDRPSEVQEEQNQNTETLKEVQPENTEASPKVNGTMMNQEVAIEPDESQTTMSDHPLEGTVKEVTCWPEGYYEA